MTPPKPRGPRCPGHCPGSHPCTLDSSPAHELHICADEHCYCHTQARYGDRPFSRPAHPRRRARSIPPAGVDVPLIDNSTKQNEAQG